MTDVATPNNASVGIKITDTATGSVTNAGSVQFGGGAVVSSPGANQALVRPVVLLTMPYKAAVPPGILYVAPTGGAVVLSVTGYVATAEGATSVLQPRITNAGTTITSGATLTTDTFNANGTVSQPQTLTLIAAPTLAAGQGIAVTPGGTLVTGIGVIAIRVQELG